MTAKVRKALLYILICLVILTLFTASLTLGRFTSEEGSKGNYGGQDFEFTVSDMIEISSEDEFFTAIENGYSNIQISDDIDKIIISGGVSEVGADLTIDLNGKELQRNNRDPMLDVQEGVRLTIIDTSKEQTGCFYNPVGTVLRVSGGTLTVNAGTFESGPRDENAKNAGHKSEYAEKSGTTWSTPEEQIVVDESASTNDKFRKMPGAKIQNENGESVSTLQEWKDGKWSPVDDDSISMPIIVPGAVQVVDGNSARIKVNGNMYFAEEGGYNNNKYIPADTYLYFTLEDEVVSNTTIAAGGSANYKYSYYLTRNGVTFTYTNDQNAEGAVEVTVFVYQGVKGAAGTDGSGNAGTSFAAIQMAEGEGGETGNIYVQKGSDYHAYFGVDNTYCVQASAGYMAVEGGTFRAYGNSVCVECSYDSGAADDEYLRVGSGTFYSENADTVRVTGGKMDVVTATLEKNSEKSTNTHNGAAIKVQGGSLSVTSGATITVTGDYNYGIFSDGVGLVRINTARSAFNMSLKGSNNYGIYSKPAEDLTKIEPIVIGSTASSSSGGVNANITIDGNNSRAIYSEGGDIGIANGGGEVTFTLTGSQLQGIYATGGRIDVCQNGGTANFYLGYDGVKKIDDAKNISAIVTMAGSSSTLAEGDNPDGVYVGSSASTINFTAYGSTMAGIYAQAGAVEVQGTTTFSFTGTNCSGIYTTGGSVVVGVNGGTTAKTFNLCGSQMYGIVAGGIINTGNISGTANSALKEGLSAELNGEVKFNFEAIKDNNNFSQLVGVYSNGGTVMIDGNAGFTFGESAQNGNAIVNYNGYVNLTGTATISFGANAAKAHGIHTFDTTADKTTNEGKVDLGGATTITFAGGTSLYGINSVGGDVKVGGADTQNASLAVTLGESSAVTSSNGIYVGTYQNSAAGSSVAGSLSVAGTATISVGANATTVNGISNSGTVNINGDSTSITFASGAKQSFGIYSTGGTVTAGGDKFTCNMATVAETDKTSALTSAAIYSNTTDPNSAITISAKEVDIDSGDLGIVLTGGNLNFGSDTQNSTITIDTPRGTGIYVAGGSLTAHANATVLVKSTISGATWDENVVSQSNIYNGVFVNGGSLTANGTFNVTHNAGFADDANINYLYNDYANVDYLSQQIKSFAVRVESGGTSSTVNIAGGEITNEVGGGIYVGGGTVTLGVENTNDGPTVQTTGNLLYATATFHDGGLFGDDYYTWNWSYVVGGSWRYMLNKSGGHAVEVSGGSLTVHGGNYSAQQGNGILIRNTDNSGTQTSNEVTINGGTFTGYNSGYYIGYDYGQKPLGDSDRLVGPAASYGLNVMGHSLKVTINSGLFGDKDSVNGNSAASFFGTPGGRTTVNVYGGTFDARNADAISVFRFIDITFNGTKSDISSTVSSVTGVASLSVQDDLLYTNDSERNSTITINNGTFTGTAYGIYYACGVDKLKITKGTFIGSDAGLYLYEALKVTHAVVITGGTFGTSDNSTSGLHYRQKYAVNDGLLIMGGTFTGKSYGVNLVQNPWSSGPYNNVAIVGGTFTGGTNAIRAQGGEGGVQCGDVLIMHDYYDKKLCYGSANGINGNAGGGEGGYVIDKGKSFTLTTVIKQELNSY